MSCSTGPLVDAFNRRISYLRLSVTDRCDLRCTYCMPERMQFLPRKEVLSLEELHKLSLAFIERGITKIRLTGGEPLVRRDVIELVRAIGRKLGDGLDELTLTTNGTQLEQFAKDLAAAGVKRINVSLDTMDSGLFEKLSRRDRLNRVLRGIAAARDAGLKVKLNTVALKGLNEEEIPFLVEWAHRHGHDITLIETMPLGDVEEDRVDHYLPLPAVQDALEKRWTLTASDYATGGPSRYFDIAETGGRIGFITPLTNNFCASCNRIRVTATGQLYACLGGAEKVDLRAALRSETPDELLADALDEAMRIKPERHHFRIERGAAPAQPRHMSLTGG
ncbi:cyclic pyranopterin phosphate synthase [Altererythrobacter atlanticus]|uniref:GTP 3',8-cyclase n=1 Tax=Croceibacterium atlanticum TaxID=1267766 RepID=A0A0F7KU50_9SPHN|nr:GTP 3',8-cyclase MoaA [Croceibacterium atlanticum]AKH42315.1 Cyclic pyranopterin monophosphate synthase [Croceibacterium atlanticum]MBB5731092.1 cyclic pyranopterin phosphate synthase [Croceibacterium atlanticum]